MTSALLAAMLAASALASPAEAPLGFRCPTPKGWSSAVEESALRLTGPAGADGLPSMILVRFYPDGDQGFADADDYVARQTGAPPFKVSGEERGPAVATKVAGRAARRVTQTHFRRFPDHSPDSRRVRMRAVHVVVPAEKGFFVILDDAPAALAKANDAALSRVLAGFRPER